MLDPSIIIGTNQVPAGGGLPPVGVSAEQLNQATQQAARAEARAKLLAAALELQSQLDACQDFQAAALLAARQVADELAAKRAMIGWRANVDAELEIVADTDPAASGDTALATAAMDEISARGEIAALPADGDGHRHSLLATRQFAKSIVAQNLVATPLADRHGKPLGALLVIDHHNDDSNHSAAMLDVLSPMLAVKLKHFHAVQPRRWERIIRSLTDPTLQRGRRIAGLLALVFFAIMLIPVRYNIPANCELQPVHRRFVAAPFDGPLEKVLVRPGDVVQQGEIIARINPREIDYKIAGLRADLKRAQQEKKGLLAEHDFGGSKIAALEAERIQMDTDLLEYQRENLEIRSPLAGVVVDGDLETSEGTPLTKGETLFEIAPLGEMIVEVAIGEDDVAYAREAMTVEFYLHALPGRNLRGTLKHVHPQAELRDHDNVFIGEVHVSDPDGVLRPGMRGRAWIHSDRHPLGWNLFHKAYFAVCRALGW